MSAAKQQQHAKQYFSGWYDQNKDRISAKRKARYHSDPDYRAKAIENARKSRERRLAERPELPRIYKYGSRDAADAIGCTANDLRAWRSRDHFPPAFQQGGRSYYTERQVQLLRQLKEFFDAHGTRVREANRDDFETLKNLITVNWIE